MLFFSVCVLLSLPATVLAQSPKPSSAGETVFDPATLKPFTSGALYLGKYETGLYPGGKNERPPAHREIGERLAATIRPLDTEGRLDDQGRVNRRAWPARQEQRLRAASAGRRSSSDRGT